MSALPDHPATSLRYRPTLAVYVVWLPRSQAGRQLAHALYRHLARDLANPLERAIDLPVLFRSAPYAAGSEAPRPIDLELARRSVVVLLVDTEMVLARNHGWSDYAAEILRRCDPRDSPHRTLPILLGPAAQNLLPGGFAEQGIRIPSEPAGLQEAALLNRVDHELCRLLLAEKAAASRTPPPPVRLFISHAKADGLARAEQLRDYIHRSTTFDAFFDATTIVPAYQFVQQIEDNLADPRAALLVLQTDEYTSRPWCRREVLIAKRQGCPVAVVHSVRQGEERSFPYLGNVRTLRVESTAAPWDDLTCERVLGLALREVLRESYLRHHFSDVLEAQEPLAPWEAELLARPPELLTLLYGRQQGSRGSAAHRITLYPDPPLGEEELEVLSLLEPETVWITPTILPLFRKPARAPQDTAGLPRPLAGITVGLSISISPDLERLGFSESHLRQALLDLARYLLAAGATLSYGGNFRENSYTEALIDLVRAHHRAGDSQWKPIRNYLAWPHFLSVDRDREGLQLQEVEIVRIPEGASLPAPADPPTEQNLFQQALWLTEMRARMTREIDARIILGGTSTGYSGRYPGLAEEALLALAGGKPVFLLGSFGGSTAALIEAARGGEPQELTEGFQLADPAYAARVSYGRRRQLAEGSAEGWPLGGIDYGRLVAFLRERGIDGLGNGLSRDDNERLFATEFVHEMVQLVLKGLGELAARRQPAPAGPAAGA